MNKQCYFCDSSLGTLADGDACHVNGPHWTGSEYIRVDLCGGCHSTGHPASAPRKPRRKRTQPAYAATDWNMLVAFSQRAR